MNLLFNRRPERFERYMNKNKQEKQKNNDNDEDKVKLEFKDMMAIFIAYIEVFWPIMIIGIAVIILVFVVFTKFYLR